MRKLSMTLAVTLAVGVLVVIFYDDDRSATMRAPAEDLEPAAEQSAVSGQGPDTTPATWGAEAEVEVVEALILDEEKLQDGQDALTALINEYNMHLHDRDKRAEIEQRAAEVAVSYKQQVLAKVKSLK